MWKLSITIEKRPSLTNNWDKNVFNNKLLKLSSQNNYFSLAFSKIARRQKRHIHFVPTAELTHCITLWQHMRNKRIWADTPQSGWDLSICPQMPMYDIRYAIVIVDSSRIWMKIVATAFTAVCGWPHKNNPDQSDSDNGSKYMYMYLTDNSVW